MTFPAVVGRQLSNDTANGTSHAVTWPTVSGGILAGDVALIVCGIDGGLGTVAWPDGSYVELEDLFAFGVNLAVAYRRMSGGESGTFTVTTSGSQGGGYVVLIVRGVHASTNPVIGTANAGFDTAPDPLSLTAPWGAEDNLWVALGSSDSNVTITGSPASYANLQNALWNDATNGAGAFTAERSLNAASEDAGTFTMSAIDGWTTDAVVFRPAGPAEVTAGIPLGLAVAPVVSAGEVTAGIPLGLTVAPVVSRSGVALPSGKLVIQVAPGADPADSGTWGALWESVKVRANTGARIKIGVQSEGQSTESGECEIVAINRDGRWTPEDPLGAWFGLIGEDVPLRVLWDGVEEFIGLISEIEPDWDRSGEGAFATVRARGNLYRHQRGVPLVRSAVTRHVLRLATGSSLRTPWGYWPLEGDDFSSPFEGIGPFTGSSGLDRGAASTPVSSLSVLKLPVGATWAAPLTLTAERDLNRVALLYQVPEAPGAGDHIAVSFTTTLDFAHRFELSTSSTQFILRRYDSTDTLVSTNAVALTGGFFGAWHVFELDQYLSGGTFWFRLRVYDADGTLITTAINQDSGTAATTVGQIVAVGPVTTTQEQLMGHLLVETEEPLLENSVATLLDGAVFESGADRINRLASEDGFTFTIVGVGSDTMLMGAQRARSLIDLLREIEDADGGILSDTATGIIYRTRTSMLGQDVALYLSTVRDAKPVRDDRKLINDVSVHRPGGDTVRLTADAPVRRETDREINTASDFLLHEVASWLLHLGTQPQMRWPSITVQLHRDASLIPDVQALRLGDRVTLGRFNFGIPIDLLVVGWEKRITDVTYDLILSAIPAAPWAVGMVDEHRADTDGSELAAAFDAGTDTSMSVAVTAGPLWTTDAGAAPFDIYVSGVVLRVTAVSGASSPQTFTVDSEPVNGIVKSISAGETISLARPAIVGL